MLGMQFGRVGRPVYARPIAPPARAHAWRRFALVLALALAFTMLLTVVYAPIYYGALPCDAYSPAACAWWSSFAAWARGQARDWKPGHGAATRRG